MLSDQLNDLIQELRSLINTPESKEVKIEDIS